MRIGDIKIEALKLMFANYSFDMGIEDLPNMTGDENYGSYLVNMDGSISRALDRIQNACVLPIKSRRIEESEVAEGKYFNRFDMTVIKDLYIFDRLVAESADGDYNGNAEYWLEGDNILVIRKGWEHSILYYPTIKTVDESVDDTDDIWIPEHIARLIPYFIKGELYQEEEPSLAADARNTFEMSLDDLKRKQQSNQTRIVRVI